MQLRIQLGELFELSGGEESERAGIGGLDVRGEGGGEMRERGDPRGRDGLAAAGEFMLEVLGHGGGGHDEARRAGAGGGTKFLKNVCGLAGAGRAEEQPHADRVQRREPRRR